MIRRLALLFALLSATPVLAETVPVKVTADQFTVAEDDRSATFSGNVIVTRGPLTMWSDSVVIHYGKGGQGDIESLTATGHVKVKTTDQQASGGRATYDPSTQVIRLTENVTVSNGSGTVSGPDLTINLNKNTTVFQGGKGGRVTGVFTPQ
jgi:lipopolysaccharide export system protein LptA